MKYFIRILSRLNNIFIKQAAIPYYENCEICGNADPDVTRIEPFCYKHDKDEIEKYLDKHPEVAKKIQDEIKRLNRQKNRKDKKVLLDEDFCDYINTDPNFILDVKDDCIERGGQAAYKAKKDGKNEDEIKIIKLETIIECMDEYIEEAEHILTLPEKSKIHQNVKKLINHLKDYIEDFIDMLETLRDEISGNT